jgi:hypothetical protein
MTQPVLNQTRIAVLSEYKDAYFKCMKAYSRYDSVMCCITNDELLSQIQSQKTVIFNKNPMLVYVQTSSIIANQMCNDFYGRFLNDKYIRDWPSIPNSPLNIPVLHDDMKNMFKDEKSLMFSYL